MNAYIEIIRPGNAVMAVIAIILVAIVSKTYNLSMLFSILAVFFTISGGNVINDVFDYKIDAINRPNRAIPSGRISVKNARFYAYFLFFCGVICGLIISLIVLNPIPCIIVVFSAIVLYIYAFALKTTPLFGNFLVGFMTCLCFVFGGFCAGLSIGSDEIIYISGFLGFFALLATMGREITKDIEDIEGDESEGAKTFPILYGSRVSSIIVFILVLIACILSPLLYFTNIFNRYYLVIVAFSVLVFLYSIIILLKNPEKNAHETSKFLKIGMLIAFVSFAIGSL